MQRVDYVKLNHDENTKTRNAIKAGTAYDQTETKL